MRALSDRVMVEIPEGCITEEGGIRARSVEGSSILRPESTVQMRPNECVVTGIGERVDLPIKEGDRVLCRWWTGLAMTLNGKPTVLTEQKNVLAIVDDGDSIE